MWFIAAVILGIPLLLLIGAGMKLQECFNPELKAQREREADEGVQLFKTLLWLVAVVLVFLLMVAS